MKPQALYSTFSERTFTEKAMLIVSVSSAFFLSACGSDNVEEGLAAPVGEAISCSLDGAKLLGDTCTVERQTNGGKEYLILRNETGGFRRLEVLPKGGGVVVADGADEGVITLNGDMLDVSIGKDRYRLPVKLKANGGQ